jgi:hypothetical protein
LNGGCAGGVVMLGLFSLMLPSGKAADAPGKGMAERMATLEQKLAAMAFDPAAYEVVIPGRICGSSMAWEPQAP